MNKGIRKNNKGMTLVELLVAIAIFAAAIVPMLYAFVYSTGYNFRSQRVMQSTGIAQAIIERTKGANVSITQIEAALADGSILNSGTQFTVAGVTGASGSYTLTGVRTTTGSGDAVDAGNANRRAYDVVVEYNEIAGNNTDTSTIQSMSSNMTANFTEANAETLLGEDAVAQSKIIEKIAADVINGSNVYRVGGGTLPVGDHSSNFSENDIIVSRIVIDRKIIITASDSGVNIKVEYYCAGYDSDDDGIVNSNQFSLEAKTITISGTDYNVGCRGSLSADYTMASGSPFYVADFDGTPNDGMNLINDRVTAVFFYYYPAYKSVSPTQRNDHRVLATYNDNFVIKNTMTGLATNPDPQPGDVPIDSLDIYIFKQFKDGVFTPDGYNDAEHHYAPNLDLTSNAIKTNIYHNLLYDVRDGSSLKTYSGSFASNVASHITNHSTTLCFNRTDFDSYLVTNPGYVNGLRDLSDGNVSHLLSDQASMPYMAEELSGAGPVDHLFQSRWQITVTVYPAGAPHDGANVIETMTSEFVNW